MLTTTPTFVSPLIKGIDDQSITMADLFFHSATAVKSWSFTRSSSCFPSPFLSPRSLPFFSSLPISSPKHAFKFFSAAKKPSKDSVSQDFHLVSTTEHKDGSFVFRFGDASELAKNVGEKAVATPKGEANKSHPDASPVNDSASDHETGTSDRLVEVDPVEMINYKILSAVNLREADHVVMEESSSRGNDDVYVSGVDETSRANDKVTALGLDMVSSEEVNEESNHAEDESKFETALPSFESGVPDRFASRGGCEENTRVEAGHIIADSNSPNVHMGLNPVSSNDGFKINVVKVVPVCNEANLEEEPTTKAMDVPVHSEGTEGSKVLGDDLPSSNLEEEIIEGEGKNCDEDMSVLHNLESQTASAPINGEESPLTQLFLSSGASLKPNSSKALAGGEDAYFVDQNWLGIADGVGLWSFEGINAGLYAQELIQNCRKIVSENENICMTEPLEVLNKASAETHSSGSSTALIAYFDGQAFHVANIGDSGFFIIRDGTIFKRSSPMVHEFYFPLQIEKGGNTSEPIEGYKIDLNEDDIIIIATDGLFDNIYDKEIASIVTKALQASLKPQDIAELLARRAQEAGQTVSARTPFADAAHAAGYIGYTGGKPDNVTVIVSLVRNRSMSS